MSERRSTVLSRAAPFLFVVLWASGFVVARLVRPYAEPESFVALRFALSTVVLAAIAFGAGAPWPRRWPGWRDSLIAGALMQGFYVGGVFWAVKHGLPAAVAALISGLQPLLTAALARPLLGEHVSLRRWFGILLGFLGALLVLAPEVRGTTSVPPVAILAGFGAMVAITLGTIWQKRIALAVDLRSGAAIQFAGGLAVVLVLALATESFRIEPRLEIWFGLVWGVCALSVCATLLLLALIRRGAIARVTALFYMAPPLTALMALGLFGDGLATVQIVGMVVATLGVWLADRG